MTVPAPAHSPAPPQKTVAVKPSSAKSRKQQQNQPQQQAAQDSSQLNIVQLPGGLTLPLNMGAGEDDIETRRGPNILKGRRGRKKKVQTNANPAPVQATSPPPQQDQMETILIEAGDNIIQVQQTH